MRTGNMSCCDNQTKRNSDTAREGAVILSDLSALCSSRGPPVNNVDVIYSISVKYEENYR